MSWDILLPDRPNKNAVSPVTVTISKTGGRFEPRMLLTVRTEAAGAPPWVKPGVAVTVERGAGQHEGCYRITPNGPWRLGRSAGRTASVTIKLPVPSGAPKDGCSQLGAVFVFADGRLDIELPKWGADAKATPRRDYPPASRQGQDFANVAAQAQPYVGISARVPDPAKAIQAQNGGRVR